MRIVVFGSQRRVGLWKDDTVIDVNNAVASYLATTMSEAEAQSLAAFCAPAELGAFIAAGEEALSLLRKAVDHVAGSSDGSIVLPISLVRLRAPWPRRRIFCAGVNYGKHVADAQTNYGNPMTRKDVEDMVRAREPEGFTKTPYEAVDPFEDVIYPSRSTQFDYEGELAVVIGTRAKDVSVEDAKKCIWGVTLANDLSDRDGTQHTKYSISFNFLKNFDSCIPLGPSILVDETDPQSFGIVTKINGEVRQDYNTNEMIYSFAEYISYLSKDYTLVPGDVILGGTGAGTAADVSKRNADTTPVNLDLFLKVGDLVEISSPKIGTLINRIVEKR